MRAILLSLVLAAACGGGGGSTPPPAPLSIPLDVGVIRADVASTRTIRINNPLLGVAEASVPAPVAGPFAPAPGALPAQVPAGFFDLAVVVTPGSSGTVQGGFTVHLEGPGGPQDLVLALTALAETPLLRLDTLGGLAFGDVLVGERAQRSVRVSNPSQLTPVTVLGVTGLPAAFLAPSFPVTVAAGSVRDLVFEYAPPALADVDTTLQLAHDAAGGPLAVRLRATTTTWPQEIVTDYGAQALQAGRTDWLEVQVPSHAVSLSLEAIGPLSTTPGLLALEGPGGTVYENEQATGAYLWFPGDDGVFTATVPNSDHADVLLVAGGGTYRFRIYLLQGSAASLQVRAIVHNRPGGTIADGDLPLNVFLAPGLGLAASAAATDSRLQSVLAETDRVLGQRGLRLGEIRYKDLTQAAYNDVSQSEFPSMLQESQGAEPGLNLFLVQSTFGGGTVGVAARLAGPARNGTAASGVMVDYDFAGAVTVGRVAAHEIGHYLGLMHTVEQDGSFDIIDDTLECPPTAPGGPCATEGNDYLMHWRVLAADPVLTAAQGRIVLGHPLVVPAGPRLTASALLLAPGPPSDPLPDGWCATCTRR